MILTLAAKSLRNRGFTAALMIVSIASAVALLIAVERIRDQARESFASTISGTDVIVGARSSPVHLLLFSVFRIGDAANNISWTSYRALAARPDVAWTIPVSLGDSHRGFRVLGTTGDYFAHFRYADARPLSFSSGRGFRAPNEAVIGAEVARALGYGLDQQVVLAHGSGEVSFSLHKDQPFRVAGILAGTGTPADRTIHVSLEGLDALHDNARAPAGDPLQQAIRQMAAKENSRAHGRTQAAHDDEHAITAFFVGLKSRSAALNFQRAVNQFAAEPLTAILPGATLLEVWSIVGVAEQALLAVSVLVLVVGLCTMLVALLTGLEERRREMAVLRSVGARPLDVFALIVGEAALLTLVGIVLGLAVVEVGMRLADRALLSWLGFRLEAGLPTAREWVMLAVVALAGPLVSIIPAFRIYRFSLADGMAIRL